MDRSKLELAITLFAAQEPKDDEETIFLTLSSTEACWINLATMAGLATLREALATAQAANLPQPVIERLAEILSKAEVTEQFLWEKILGCVEVQIFGREDNPNPTSD